MDDLVLYGFWRSIASYRVRVALRLKKLTFEERPIDLLAGAQSTPQFSAINAARSVPVLVGPGFVLTQSQAIIEFLDETCAEPKFLPPNPIERARSRALAQLTIADTHPLIVPSVRLQLHERFGADDDATTLWARHFLARGLATYETLLAATPPAPCINGTTPGLADIAVASHAVAVKLFGLSLETAPTVAKLFAHLSELPAFADSHPLRQPGAPAPG